MEREFTPSTPPVMPPSNNNNRTGAIVGTIIILLGIMLLLNSLNIGNWFPRWLFGWEMIFIIIGLVIGVNSRFEKKSSYIFIGLGTFFLLKDMLNFSIGKLLIPMIAIGVGIYLIMRSNKHKNPTLPPTMPESDPSGTKGFSNPEFDWDKRVSSDHNMPHEQATNDHSPHDAQQSATGEHPPFSRSGLPYENYLKIEAILGNTKKIILSKNFLGGNLTNVFGSSEINLLQADLQQPVALDIFQLFGSTKIIVPPHWMVTTNVSSILAENDDRRVIISKLQDHRKHLFITGTSIFGTITIKNS